MSVSYLLDINRQGAFSVARDRQQDLKLASVFAISVVGIGVFIYYQGRSHNYNLIAISWPAYLLLALFTDRILKIISRIIFGGSTPTIKLSLLIRYAHLVIFFAMFFYFLGSSVTSTAMGFSEYKERISNRLAGINQTSQSLTQQAEFIKSTSTLEDTVLLLSDEATELYLYTNHPRPLDIPGFGELVAKADLHQLEQFLRHPPEGSKIYWDTSFRPADPRIYDNLTPTMSSQDLILFEAVESLETIGNDRPLRP